MPKRRLREEHSQTGGGGESSSSQERPQPPASAAQTPGVIEMQSGSIALRGVALRQISYDELVSPAELGLSGPVPMDPSQLGITGTLNLFQEHGAEVLLEGTLVARVQGRDLYRIRATVAGLFVAQESVSPRQLAQFAADTGLRLLFPYFREIVSSISGRGVFGQLLLDPVSIGPLLKPEQLNQLRD